MASSRSVGCYKVDTVSIKRRVCCHRAPLSKTFGHMVIKRPQPVTEGVQMVFLGGDINPYQKKKIR